MTVVEESRAIARLLDKKKHVFLDEVSWTAYQKILDKFEAEGRRFRHTYDQGRLEIMTRSGRHEVPKSLIGSLVLIMADELDRPIFMGGELTLQRKAVRRGIEPDQCYWIANERLIRGKDEVDFDEDPPPDLFIEVEVSRTIINRLNVLAALRVPEVWRLAKGKIRIGVLQPDGRYQWGDHSPSFPEIKVTELVRFLQLARTTDHLTVLREFRKWVRKQLAK